jgi:hypothetical protein
MRRLLERAPDWLGRRWVPPAIILLALLLVSPCLSVKMVCDDYILLARVDPRAHVPGCTYAPLDLFALISGDPLQRAALMQEGVMAWWAAPDLRGSFWRPLSSLTHVVDFLARPRSALVAHAHSMLWFAALLAVVGGLYRRFHVPWVAHLALLLYALDDAHGLLLSWIANRNALVAATFAFAALLAHDRARRDTWQPGTWLAPMLFGAALLSGEAALAVTGYLVAHALFIDQGPLVRRLSRLWPYAILASAWLAAYRALGYGARGLGLYDDPTDGLVRYLGVLVERLPVLLAAQLGFAPSDLWPHVPRTAQLAISGVTLATLVAVALVLGPVLRREPVCRFWAVGAVLSLPPMCATFPSDRLLAFAGVGAMAAIAMLMAEALQRDTPAVLGRGACVARRIVLPLLVLAHLVMAPLLLPFRALTMALLGGMIQDVDNSIPKGDSIREKTLVIVNSRADFFVLYVPVQRAVLGVPRPRGMRILSSGLAAVHVSRLDARTLRVRPAKGFLRAGGERLVRGLSRPFHAGDKVALPDVRVRVNEVTADGRPAEADFFFNVPLEDASLLWMQWRRDALSPYSPPAVGESHVLPPISGAAPNARAQQ